MMLDDADDKVDKVDRSRNVIILGIDEVTDTITWWYMVASWYCVALYSCPDLEYFCWM